MTRSNCLLIGVRVAAIMGVLIGSTGRGFTEIEWPHLRFWCSDAGVTCVRARSIVEDGIEYDKVRLEVGRARRRQASEILTSRGGTFLRWGLATNEDVGGVPMTVEWEAEIDWCPVWATPIDEFAPGAVLLVGEIVRDEQAADRIAAVLSSSGPRWERRRCDVRGEGASELRWRTKPAGCWVSRNGQRACIHYGGGVVVGFGLGDGVMRTLSSEEVIGQSPRGMAGVRPYLDAVAAGSTPQAVGRAAQRCEGEGQRGVAAMYAKFLEASSDASSASKWEWRTEWRAALEAEGARRVQVEQAAVWLIEGGAGDSECEGAVLATSPIDAVRLCVAIVWAGLRGEGLVKGWAKREPGTTGIAVAARAALEQVEAERVKRASAR